MRFRTASALAVVGIPAALSLAIETQAAPSGPGSAADIINRLETEGLRVIINRVGTGPLSECTVTRMAAGRDVTRRDATGDDSSVERLRYRTVHVTVTC